MSTAEIVAYLLAHGRTYHRRDGEPVIRLGRLRLQPTAVSWTDRLAWTERHAQTPSVVSHIEGIEIRSTYRSRDTGQPTLWPLEQREWGNQVYRHRLGLR